MNRQQLSRLEKSVNKVEVVMVLKKSKTKKVENSGNEAVDILLAINTVKYPGFCLAF